MLGQERVVNKNVLVVEDDDMAAHLVERYLERDGFRVAVATDGRQGLEMASTTHPDLVILDLMLPHVDGLEICRQLRLDSKVPIILLTARASEKDKLLGFELGADDYITKPFSPKELLARAKAVLRRAGDAEANEPDVNVGDLSINFARHEVCRNGRPVNLTPTEFRLLATLAKNPGRVFTRAQLVDQVLGPDYAGFERTIDVHVLNLRRKVELDPACPQYVQTVFGVGYKLAANPDAA